MQERQAGKCAQNTQRALRAKHGAGGGETFGRPPREAREAGNHCVLDPRRDITPGVLQHRDEIVSGLTQLRELEVEQADTRKAVTTVKPQHVFGMIVAQDDHRRVGRMGIKRRLECGRHRRALARVAKDRAAIPLGRKSRRDHHRCRVIGGKSGGRRMGLKVDENTRRSLVKRHLCLGAALEHTRIEPIAQILEQEKSQRGIGGKRPRRAEAKAAQMRRDELEAAWNWIDPIRESWDFSKDAPQLYTAGTWGPTGSVALIERDGRTWHEGEA